MVAFLHQWLFTAKSQKGSGAMIFTGKPPTDHVIDRHQPGINATHADSLSRRIALQIGDLSLSTASPFT